MSFFCRNTSSSANNTESKVLIEIGRVEKLIKELNNTIQEKERNVTHFQNELTAQKDKIKRKHKNTLNAFEGLERNRTILESKVTLVSDNYTNIWKTGKMKNVIFSCGILMMI